ncbi:MAG: phytoene desaturase family protein [Anaerolineae bacterium]
MKRNMGTTRQPVIVIGAGIGGLTAAIRLAGRGYPVTVVEQLDRPGGKMGEWRAGGFRFDTGPSVVTMRPVIERLFHEAGRRLEDYLDLAPLHPITRYHWRDGTVLDALQDEEAMCAEIARINPREVDGYRRFMRYVAELHRAVSRPFLYSRQPGWRDVLRLPIADVLKIDALRTMHQAIRAHFRDPRLIQLFSRFATYNGSSPYRSPATLNVIAHVEMAQGAWYPRGGVYQIALALERLARDLGAEIRYGSRVEKIEVRSGRVVGVLLTDGSRLEADAVIANADVSDVYRRLVDDGPVAQRGQRQADRLEPSCSGFVMLIGATRQTPRLAHHNIFFSDDYPGEFSAIFDQRIPPPDPTVYLCITSKTDPDHAPAGCENWFVLVNAPYLSPAYDWERNAETYAAHLKEVMRGWGLDAGSPLVERVYTPLHLQAMYGGNAGAIYGFSSNTRTAAFRRPGNRARDVRGLYFASGSAHPGGGVPLVMLSGIAASACVEEDVSA